MNADGTPTRTDPREIILNHECEWETVMVHSKGETQQCTCHLKLMRVIIGGEIRPVIGSVPINLR